MKHNLKTKTAMILMLTVAALSADAAYVILQGNRKLEGTGLRMKPNGDVVLTTAAGLQTIPKGQYLSVVADEPPEYNKGRQLAAAGKLDEAITLFEGIVANYKGLTWDAKAIAELSPLYLKKGEGAKAVTAYENMFAISAQSKTDPATLWGYREALLKAERYAKLEQDLNSVIATGSREDAARAQIMRGDMNAAQGRTEPAALDYLRTVVLYKAVKDIQPEALFKAAGALEALRDARAKDLYAEIVRDYAGSPYAAQAAGKK
ncbi:MAG: hypothetical protein AB7T27_02355 [Kiritimatiellia bacterium]